MNKFLTFLLTIFVFSLKACAIFNDPLMQRTYDECVASKMNVAQIKSIIAASPLANSITSKTDKKAVCKSFVEVINKILKENKASKKQRYLDFTAYIDFFRAFKGS